MAQRSFQLLAADLDGTLLGPDYQLSPRTRQALLAARRTGVRLAILTGRILAAARPVLDRAGLRDVLLAAHNGAVVQDLASGSFLWAHCLDRKLALEALAAATQVPGPKNVALAESPAEGGRLLLAAPPTSGMRRYLESIPLDPAVTPDLSDFLRRHEPSVVEVTVSGRTQVLDQVERAVAERLGRRVSIVSTRYPERDLVVLDVLPKGATKAKALADLASELGVPREGILALGDNANDLEMLRFAGLGVLMGNAPSNLDASGLARTASHTEDGAALAIERYLLGRR